MSSGRFDVVQTYYNLLNPSAGEEAARGFGGQDFGKVIEAAARQRMGVAVIRVMAGGALGGPEARSGYASASVGGALADGGDYDRDEERAGKLSFLASTGPGGLPEAAIRFALMDQRVSTVMVGFSNREQIDMAAACSGAGPIPATLMDRVREVWAKG